MRAGASAEGGLRGRELACGRIERIVVVLK